MGLLLLFAHDIGLPHEEMAQRSDGSAGTLVVVAVVLVSALVLAALLVLRKRLDAKEAAEAGPSNSSSLEPSG